MADLLTDAKTVYILEVRVHLTAEKCQLTADSGLRGWHPSLSATHMHIKGCGIIEICIIHELFQCVESTCDWETHNLSLSLYKMPAVRLLTVRLPAEEQQARVHPSDPSYIHTTKWCWNTHTYTHTEKTKKEWEILDIYSISAFVRQVTQACADPKRS